MTSATQEIAESLKELRRATEELGLKQEAIRQAQAEIAKMRIESLTAKALRAQLIAAHGANPKWMRAAGYWRRGAVAVHDNFND